MFILFLRSFTPSDFFAGLSSIFTFITLIILIKELTNQRKSLHSDSYKAIIDILQEKEVREARKALFKMKGSKLCGNCTPTEEDNIEMVCQTYDSVGQLVRNEFIPKKFVIDNWGHSILYCWEISIPHINKLRTESKSNKIWDDFEWLYYETKKYY